VTPFRLTPKHTPSSIVTPSINAGGRVTVGFSTLFYARTACILYVYISGQLLNKPNASVICELAYVLINFIYCIRPFALRFNDEIQPTDAQKPFSEE